ncbi:hypothetical protein GCM10022275_34400 [Tessaracoccus defluvii]
MDLAVATVGLVVALSHDHVTAVVDALESVGSVDDLDARPLRPTVGLDDQRAVGEQGAKLVASRAVWVSGTGTPAASSARVVAILSRHSSVTS